VLQFLAVREYRRGSREEDPDEDDTSDDSDEEDLDEPHSDDEYSDSDDYDAEVPQEGEEPEGTEAEGDQSEGSEEEEEDLEFSDDEDEDAPLTFVAGRHWRRKFMKRHGLSLRRPHAKRRPKTEPMSREVFQARMARIMRLYPPDMTINMDETSWKQIIINNAVTIAERGAETVTCYFKGDPKTCLTAIASINAAGEKLPLWILARGTTGRCEARYRNHDKVQAALAGEELVLDHQRNGWSCASVMARYLQWLRARYNFEKGRRGGRRTRRILLLWDIFPSHRCQETKDLADLLSIRLEYIPPGMTGECQPLDRRIFGNLKARARSRFDEMCCKGEDPTMEDSVAMLVEAWKSISQFEVLDAWQP
jgi:hypothetical protein